MNLAPLFAATGPLGGPELAILAVVVLSVLAQLSRNKAITLVITKWRASNVPDAGDGRFVVIVGRREGIISWLLSILGVDATSSIQVSETRIEFEEASLSGKVKRLIPLKSVCSTLYGFTKPWKKALVIAALLFAASSFIATAMAEYGRGPNLLVLLGGFVVSIVLGVVYYHLNKQFTLGFIEDSGHVSAIQFKRSVIEGQEINETQAAYVSQLVQALIENARNNNPNTPE
ncbi:MAG: hypothetical protein HS117_05325 [Verrucomicrobiaceae bacterium]|jgi:hypothetical protein|nr:hypothetical protein [Verrucomicrobiaceae bacterium]